MYITRHCSYWNCAEFLPGLMLQLCSCIFYTQPCIVMPDILYFSVFVTTMVNYKNIKNIQKGSWMMSRVLNQWDWTADNIYGFVFRLASVTPDMPSVIPNYSLSTYRGHYKADELRLEKLYTSHCRDENILSAIIMLTLLTILTLFKFPV